MICHAADVRLICVHHHSDSHESILQSIRGAVKTRVAFHGLSHSRFRLRVFSTMVESVFQGATLVKLILRNKEYEVKPGMTLLSALQKINVIPESVIATRAGEMILDDEILKEGDVIKLVAVISGG